MLQIPPAFVHLITVHNLIRLIVVCVAVIFYIAHKLGTPFVYILITLLAILGILSVGLFLFISIMMIRKNCINYFASHNSKQSILLGFVIDTLIILIFMGCVIGIVYFLWKEKWGHDISSFSGFDFMFN